MADQAVRGVAELFQKNLNINVTDNDTDLIEEGLIDSLILVELIMHLEKQYSITVAFEDIDLENFKSINAIEEFVSSLAER
ncbi:acyl carrier protein [Pseudomonadota bacterium]